MSYEQVLLLLSFNPENIERLTAFAVLLFERRYILDLEILPA